MQQGHNIFISYKHGTASDWVRTQLFERLQGQRRFDGGNPRVFIDLYEIYVGKAWFPQLAAAIETCGKFVPIFTTDYFESEMCSWELERAHSLDRAGRKGFVVPLLYEPQAVAKIPFAYQGVQYLDVRDPHWFSHLCNALDLTEVAPTSLQDSFVRVWVEPADAPRARVRDISIIPKELAGDRFRLHTEIRIGFQTTFDSYVTLVDVGTTGSMSVVYPTDRSGLGFCRKGQTYYFPAETDPFRFVLSGKPGQEKVRAFATRDRITSNVQDLSAEGRLRLVPDSFAEASCTFEVVD